MITRTFTHHLHRSIAAAAFVTLTAFRRGRRGAEGRHPLARQCERPELECARLLNSKEPQIARLQTRLFQVTDADEGEALRHCAITATSSSWAIPGAVLAMEQVAPEFPKTQFIAVSGNAGKPPNVMSIDLNNAQFGCQIGTLAARMSKTHKVAGVYGLQGVPNITAQAGGFRICATKAGARVRSSTSRTWRTPQKPRRRRCR